MPSTSDVLDDLLTAALSHCRSCGLALLLEDAFKMHLISQLLTAGRQIRVGGHQKNADRILRFGPSDTLLWTDVDRSSRRGRFADISVDDVGATFEFKVFGEVGSKDFPEKPGVEKDLRKLTTGAVDAAVIVCSGKTYELLCKDTKRYKLAQAFPDIKTLSTTLTDYTGLRWGSARLKVRGAKVVLRLNDADTQRVVIAVMNG